MAASMLLLPVAACSPSQQTDENATKQEANMSVSNAQIVGGIYESFGKGDIEGALAVMDETVIWFHPGSKEDIPFAGEFEGPEGVQEFFRIALSNIDVLSQDVHSTVSEGDRVLVLGHERMKVKATGKEYASEWIHAYTLKDGKVVRFDEFIDTAERQAAFATD